MLLTYPNSSASGASNRCTFWNVGNIGHGKNGPENLAMGKIGHRRNGHGKNGHGKNGHGRNGHGKYGHGTNGHGTNGHVTNGHGTNGHVYIQSGHGNVGHGKNWTWILLIQQIGMTYARELILGRFKLLTLQ